MDRIVEYLQEKYAPLGIIVYGSFADGSHNAHSDFDVLVITEKGSEMHDNTVVDGIMLDAFVYPKVKFLNAFDCKDFVQIFDGSIVFDTDNIAKELQAKVIGYINSIPPKTDAENETNVAWCEKMLLRSARGDMEGHFRWHWLLTESLEIYCDVIGKRYLGPKKSIKCMREEDFGSAKIYEKALSCFDYESLLAWIRHLKELL